MEILLKLLWIFSISCSQTSGEGDQKERRLLLNDPDVAVRLAHLEQQNKLLLDLVAKLNLTVVDLEKRSHTSGQGSTYVRWGRTVCDALDTELVYRGYTAGQLYYYADSVNYRGGPSDFLCLPDDPQISNQSFVQTDSLLYGTEYERNEFALNAANEDAPCALCRKTTSSSVIMIPGRQTCYDGWSLEYKGYLGSGHRTHTASSYICVDSSPEFIPSGHADVNGKLVYVVGYKCGPLPCPPYVNQRKVDCVVCSK